MLKKNARFWGKHTLAEALRDNISDEDYAALIDADAEL